MAAHITWLVALSFAQLVFQTCFKLFLHHQKCMSWTESSWVLMGTFQFKYDNGEKHAIGLFNLVSTKHKWVHGKLS